MYLVQNSGCKVGGFQGLAVTSAQAEPLKADLRSDVRGQLAPQEDNLNL
jgi:hypothetical protein